MKVKARVFNILPALMLFCTSAPAQVPALDSLMSRYSLYANLCSPEKLYLHVDRTYYTVGETIWFNGYLRNSSAASFIKESNFIYVELLDPAGKSIERVKIKRDGDGFPGSISIPYELETGCYTLRAYSLWQMNNPSEYMFNQRVKILAARPFGEPQPSLAEDIDVSFYPEGGRYFADTRARIGFKAMDNLGRSVEMEGCLMNERGDTISRVRTIHDGLGLMDFIPEKDARYCLLSNDGRKYPVPAPSTDGATLNISQQNGYVITSIVSAKPGGTYTLLIRDAVQMRPILDVHMETESRNLLVKESSLRPGINHLILMDDHGNTISERLFYVFDNDESRISCSNTCGKRNPSSRELISSLLTVRDASGSPIDGHFSISVTRGSFHKHVQDDGIVSYFRLSSELRGHVNDPSYYFDPAVPINERRNALNLLLMVQGWSYYDMPQVMRTDGSPIRIQHMREYTQRISGHVKSPLSEKNPQNYDFTLMIPQKNVLENVHIGKGKYFFIDSLDFKNGTGFLVNVKRSRHGLDYEPVWSGDQFAPDFKYDSAPGYALIQDEGMAVPLVSPVTDTIAAAVVSASPFSDEAANNLIFAHIMNDLGSFKDKTLLEYMDIKYPRFVYDGEYMINTSAGVSTKGGEEEQEELGEPEKQSNASTESVDETRGVVKLIVDGVEQPWWMFESVDVDNFSSIAISKEPDLRYDADGGTVSVCIRPGAMLRQQNDTKPSTLYFVPLGYEAPTRFYSPRYDLGDTDDTMDIRNTIFWSPSIDVHDGTATVEFCNTDQKDYPFIVRIEGITKDGVMFSHHCTLDLQY